MTDKICFVMAFICWVFAIVLSLTNMYLRTTVTIAHTNFTIILALGGILFALLAVVAMLDRKM